MRSIPEDGKNLHIRTWRKADICPELEARETVGEVGGSFLLAVEYQPVVSLQDNEIMEVLALWSQQGAVDRSLWRHLVDILGDEALQEAPLIFAGNFQDVARQFCTENRHSDLWASPGPGGDARRNIRLQTTWFRGAFQASSRESSIWRDTSHPRISLHNMRILFIGPSRIGDAVLASGLLNHLTANYPDARFTVACGEAAAPLFEAMPRLEHLIAMRKQPRAAHWWQLWKQVVGTRWSMVVDVRRSAIPWAIAVRRRAILPTTRDDSEHSVVSFARTLGLEADPPSPAIWLAPSPANAAERLISEGGPVLAVGPTANWIGKTWPADRFLETVERLTSRSQEAILPDARIAVFGAGQERQLAQPIIDAIPATRCIDLIGRVDLLTAAACLQRCSLYIGNDSGLMHLAAAAGIPVLGLFGPSRPERYAPWGANCAWVQTRMTLEEMVARPGYDPDKTDTLMDSLAVDDVVRAANDLWRRTRGEAA